MRKDRDLSIKEAEKCGWENREEQGGDEVNGQRQRERRKKKNNMQHPC